MVARPYEIALSSPVEAMAAIEKMAATLDETYARLTSEHLERETDVERTVASVMRWSAWHLHEHAKQIVGIQ